RVGGLCLRRGAPPSKMLQETARQHSFMRRWAMVPPIGLSGAPTEVASLVTGGVDAAGAGRASSLLAEVDRAGVDHVHGRARFVTPHRVAVTRVREPELSLDAERIFVAVGSCPAPPPSLTVDHETVLDTDSIRSLLYLPASMTVVGDGPSACEWASTLSALEVLVTMVGHHPHPLPGWDPELSATFVAALEAQGGRYCGDRDVRRVEIGDGGSVAALLDDGTTTVESAKMLYAGARRADVERLDLGCAGLTLDADGYIRADETGRSCVPHIFVVGSAAGSRCPPPGRTTARHALGLATKCTPTVMPGSVFSLPELATVGLDEASARARGHDVVVGRAALADTVRGRLSGIERGFVKLVGDAEKGHLLGAQVAGPHATELVGQAQLAVVHRLPVTTWLEHEFCFPTLGEAFCRAARDLVGSGGVAA
ncbi:MAG: NAD(P)/FAD-dependent oxidoreductase, partial [Myxococcota bacterium]